MKISQTLVSVRNWGENAEFLRLIQMSFKNSQGLKNRVNSSTNRRSNSTGIFFLRILYKAEFVGNLLSINSSTIQFYGKHDSIEDELMEDTFFIISVEN